MKKSRKIFATVLPILMLVAVMFVSFAPSVLAAKETTTTPVASDGGVQDIINKASDNKGVGSINDAANRVWSTVLTILQIAAVAAIVIAGVRYMFASADQKADIKKGMIGLVIGAVLVFAASTVVQFILTASKQIMQ